MYQKAVLPRPRLRLFPRSLALEAAKALCLEISKRLSVTRKIKFNYCGMQQNALAACGELRRAFAVVAGRNHPVICPKPRRHGPLPTLADPVRPLRLLPSHQVDRLDRCDSEAGPELLGIFLPKGGEEIKVDSSLPFFCISPPSRAANPVVLDARFGEDQPLMPISYLPPIQSGSSMPARKGCAPAKFGLKPTAVRVEGFDCRDRGRRSCSSITAVA